MICEVQRDTGTFRCGIHDPEIPLTLAGAPVVPTENLPYGVDMIMLSASAWPPADATSR